MTDEPAQNLPAVVPPPALPAETGGLTQQQLATLAREVVMDMNDLGDILKRYSISADQYKLIEKNPFYKRTFEIFLQEWSSALSTEQRIKVKAAVTLEDSLHKIGARMVKDDELLPAVVEAGKLFKSLAQIGEHGNGGPSGEKFVINIDLGGNAKLTFEKNSAPDKPIIDAVAIQPLTEGEIKDRAVQSFGVTANPFTGIPQQPEGVRDASKVQNLPQGDGNKKTV